jgi:hypothetical protein
MKDTHTQGSPRRRPLACVVCVLTLVLPCLVAAQQPAAPAATPGGREIPRPDELEPGVNTTTAPAPTPAAPEAAAAPGPAAAAAPPAPAATAGAGAGAGVAKTAGASQKETGAKTAARKGPDRLELDTTDITGNRELPKVLYIVPWKRSDLGDVVGKPVNSLLDEVLQPLDRDVFRRENRYYDALPGGAGQAKPGTAQGSPTKP